MKVSRASFPKSQSGNRFLGVDVRALGGALNSRSSIRDEIRMTKATRDCFGPRPLTYRRKISVSECLDHNDDESEAHEDDADDRINTTKDAR